MKTFKEWSNEYFRKHNRSYKHVRVFACEQAWNARDEEVNKLKAGLELAKRLVKAMEQVVEDLREEEE